MQKLGNPERRRPARAVGSPGDGESEETPLPDASPELLAAVHKAENRAGAEQGPYAADARRLLSLWKTSGPSRRVREMASS